MGMFELEAECHMELKNKKGEIFGFRVKLSVLDSDLAFYINGIVLRPPDEKKNYWRTLTPKVGKTVIVEFNGKESKLWPEVHEACVGAVFDYLRKNNIDPDKVGGIEGGLSVADYNKMLKKGLEESGY